MSTLPAKETPTAKPAETIDERFRRLEAIWLAEVGHQSSTRLCFKNQLTSVFEQSGGFFR